MSEKDNERIALIPITEQGWWKGERNKGLTIVPIIDWEFEYVPPSTDNDNWLGIREGNKYLPWPWWKIKDTKLHLFISYPTRLICIETSEIDSNDSLKFIIENVNSSKKITFYSDPWSEWDEEIVPDTQLCYKNNRELEPNISMVSGYCREGSEGRDKLIQFAEKEEGVHILKYNGVPVLKFDCKLEDDYGWIKLRMGFEEKNSHTSQGLDIIKKIAFIETFTQQKRKEWIKLVNLLSKKL